MALGASPFKLGIVVRVLPGQTFSAMLSSQDSVIFQLQSAISGTDWTPIASLDISRQRVPPVPLPTSPQKFCATAQIIRGQTRSAATPGQVSHLLDRACGVKS